MKRRFLAVMVLMGFMSTFFVTPWAQAASLTSHEDRLSQQEAGVGSDHIVRFTATSALLTPGQTVQVTFPGLFDVSAIIRSDLRLSYGATTGEETVATLAASAGTGVWGATLSGNTITLEVPSNAGVTGVQAGDQIILRIGLNAGGSHQVVNPGVPNLYRIAITTSVDAGYMFVPIVSAAALTVTATVPVLPPPPGPSPDPTTTSTDRTTRDEIPTSLVLSGATVSAYTVSSAVITWNTNVSADTSLQYGPTTAYGLSRTGATAVTSHRIELTGLQANTDYYVIVESQTGGQRVSAPLRFRTLAVGQVPVVSSLWIESLTDTRATAVFMTDILARATQTVRKVGEPVGGPSQQVYTEAGFTTSHRIDMTGLVSNTRYLVSISAQGINSGESAPLETTFTTTEDHTPPPNPSDFQATGLSRAIRLEWSASLSSGDSVIIVSRTDRVPLSPMDGRVVYTGTARTALDTGLQPARRYFYTLFAVDTRGNASSGAIANAQTLTETIPPEEGLTCPTGLHLEGTSCVRDSVIIPPPDDHLTCGTGFHIEGTECVRNSDDTVTCTTGFHMEDSRCVRDADAATCNQPGYRLEAGRCVSDTDSTILPPPENRLICGTGFHVEQTSTGEVCVRDTDRTSTSTIIIPPPDEQLSCPGGYHLETTTRGEVCLSDRDEATTSTIRIPTTDDTSTSTRILPPLPELFLVTSSSTMDVTSTTLPVPITTGDTTENQLSITEPEPASDARAHIYVANGVLELLSKQGVRTTLVGQTLLFRISLVGQTRVPVAGQLQLNGATYLLTERDGVLETAVRAPSSPGELRYAIRFSYSDNSRSQETGVIRLRPLATIREGQLIQRDRGALLQGATLEVLLLNNVLWSAAPFQETNPTVTGEAGVYGFVLANGRYRVRVRKEGYRLWEREIEVSDQVLATSLTLTKELMSLATLLEAKGTPAEKIAAIVGEASIAAQIARDVSQSPLVQAATQDVVAPVAAVATVGATATAVSTASAVNYLRFIFTQPFLLIRRRRRKKWGVVYNAFSKQPIDLAIVRLIHATSGVVVQTHITDAQGRFSFQVLPGSYRLQLLKQGFAYPSTVLKEAKEDGDFLDLYHGEVITAKEGALLTPNIPVDPLVREETPTAVIWQARLRTLQGTIGVLGIVISIGALIIAPSLLMVGFLVLQGVTYILFRRLAIPPRPSDWGIAYDVATKKPLTKTVVRIFDKKFNKLLETQITDDKGKYGFFAAKGLYYVTAEKGGYEKYVSSDIDLRQAKEAVIDQRIGLSAKKSEK